MPNDAAFRSILFPLDFSQASEAAACHVRALAKLTGANMTLLHVVPWLSAWYGTTEIRPAIAGNGFLQDLERQQNIALTTFQAKYFSNVACEGRVETGAVAETITEVAKQVGADLIMMSTRGLGRSRRFLIGSTTAKVLHDAPCAVWTSPHLDALLPFMGVHHLLGTIDEGSVPPGFIEEVTRLARCFGSRVSFLTALPRISDSVSPEPTFSVPADCRLLQEIGSVGDVVRRAVATHHVDLVVANRGHMQHPFGKLRTHTYEIVLESPCPVLSVCISTPAGTGEMTKHRESITCSSLEPARG